MEIYEKIKNRRKELGLSAEDVAESLGISRATVYRYESADIEKLPITSLVPLAKVLKCSPGYLMGWEEPAAPPDPIDAKKTKLDKLYYTMNDEGRDRLVEQAEFFASQERYKENKTDEETG